MQAKFEDKWNQVVVPKLIEAEVASRSDEAAMREKLMESANARSAEALRGEALRLKGHFESLESKIAEAKSLAAASCQPMSSAAKVGIPMSRCLYCLLQHAAHHADRELLRGTIDMLFAVDEPSRCLLQY